MTTEKAPEQNADHPDDRSVIINHLFQRWALLGKDTEALTIEEIHEDYLDAHKEIHENETDELQ